MSTIDSGFSSYIYLIGYGNNIKIGKSNNPDKRLRELQTGVPDTLSIIGLIGCCSEKKAYELEELLHKAYRKVRIRGEWFNLNPAECSFLLEEYEQVRTVNIPQKELTEAMKELSNGAYKLLMYYYSRRDGWVFLDKNIANTIGTSERQLKKFRKELIDNHYLLIQRGSVDVYFVGQLAVLRFINDVHSEEEEEYQDPLVLKKGKGE